MTTQQGSLLPARQVSRNRRQPGWWTMVLQTVWTAIHTRVTIHTLITHGGKKALPTVITRSHKTQTTNEPMFPAKGAVTCCYQLGSLQRVCIQAADVSRGFVFCGLWLCLLHLRFLIQVRQWGSFFSSYLPVVADLKIVHSQHLDRIQLHLFAISDIDFFVVLCGRICLLSILQLRVVAAALLMIVVCQFMCCQLTAYQALFSLLLNH